MNVGFAPVAMRALSRYRVAACAAIGALGFAYAFFVFRPLQADLAERRAEIARIEREALEGSREAERLPRLADEVEIAERFLRICEDRGTDGRRGELLAGLSRIAESHGLNVVGMQPEPGPEFETFLTEAIRIQMEGSFSGVAAFLSDVQRMPYAMQIQECRLSAATPEADGRRDSSDGAEFVGSANAEEAGVFASFAFVVFAGGADNSDATGRSLADR